MRIFALTAILLTLLGCDNNQEIKPAKKNLSKKVHFPYSSSESTQFEIGEDEHVKTVLDIWRAFETGNLLRLKESFAPTVTFLFPDIHMHGSRDSILQLLQEKRSQLTNVQTEIYGWVPLQTTDTKQSFVFLWASRSTTTVNGQIRNEGLIERWKFDDKGKIEGVDHYLNASWQQQE
jgi:uncharacterized lipoprotein NlpE involved in copper resistance